MSPAGEPGVQMRGKLKMAEAIPARALHSNLNQPRQPRSFDALPIQLLYSMALALMQVQNLRQWFHCKDTKFAGSDEGDELVWLDRQTSSSSASFQGMLLTAGN
jgi:hypothetical protein